MAGLWGGGGGVASDSGSLDAFLGIFVMWFAIIRLGYQFAVPAFMA